MRNKQFNWMILICMAFLSTVVIARQDKPLTNQDVIKMLKAGLPENTIVLAIQKSSNKFDTSPDALIALKEAGATQKVLNAILQAQPSTTVVTAQQDKNTRAGVLRLGAYTANAMQTTSYGDMKTDSEVEIKIIIDSVDSDGNVKGEFIHSTLGKEGKEGLTGKVILERFSHQFSL
jgi:hypothetical protein